MKLRNLVLTGVFTVLLLPMGVFADDTEVEEREWKEVRLEQVAEYTPDQYHEWNRLFDSKEVIKGERELLKTELEILIETVWKPMIGNEKAELKELIQAYASELRVQVEEGSLLKEDATIMLQTYKAGLRVEFDEMKADKDAEKLQREIDKVYYDTLRERRAGLNELIHSAVESKETEMISSYLNEILLLNQELERHGIDVNQHIEEKITELNEI